MPRNDVRHRTPHISGILAPEITTPRNRAVDWRCSVCGTTGTVLHNSRDRLLTVLALVMIQHDEARALGRRMVEYHYVDPLNGQSIKSTRRHHGMEALTFSEIYRVTETTAAPTLPSVRSMRERKSEETLP